MSENMESASMPSDFSNFIELDGLDSFTDNLDFEFPSLQERHSPNNSSNSTSMPPPPLMSNTTPFDRRSVSTTTNSIISLPKDDIGLMTLGSYPQNPQNTQSHVVSSPSGNGSNAPLIDTINTFGSPSVVGGFPASYGLHDKNVPPTPQSLYLASGTSSNLYARSPNLFFPQQRKDGEASIYTPLVSPAVTPLDHQMSMENRINLFAAPYYSPLTSPALHAQSDLTSIYSQIPTFVDPDGGSSSFTHSVTTDPAKDDVPIVNQSTSASATTSINKTSKRGREVTTSHQSSVKKYTKQKKPSLSLPDQLIDYSQDSGIIFSDTNVLHGPQLVHHLSGTHPDNMLNTQELSAVSDYVPSPAHPSSKNSPYIMPASTHQTTTPNSIESGKNTVASVNMKTKLPATPASLMNLGVQNVQQRVYSPDSASKATAKSAGSSDPFDCFQLPEPAENLNQPDPSSATYPKNLSINTGSDQMNRGTKRDNNISYAARMDENPTDGPRKTTILPTQKSGINKRRSGSIQSSPALLPKISPNLKPSVTGIHNETIEDVASRLLASKSNYQNIMEGNSVPGVNYPSELSSNITSKRTSHKLAEQGRRNRINLALQEMASLLPIKASSKKDTQGSADGLHGEPCSDGKGDGKSCLQPNSKASTVEMAIGYIKELQSAVAIANQRVTELEAQLQITNPAGNHMDRKS